MVKTASNGAKTKSSQNKGNKKQLKKQEKRETKLVTKFDRAKQEEQKAEKKVARAQSRLVDAQAHVHNLEEQLSQLRSSRQSQNGDSDTHQAELVPLEVLAVTTGAPTTQEDAITELHQESLPPAEGRADVPTDQASPSENQEDTAEPAPPSENQEDVTEPVADQESVSVFSTEEAVEQTITPLESDTLSDGQPVEDITETQDTADITKEK